MTRPTTKTVLASVVLAIVLTVVSFNLPFAKKVKYVCGGVVGICNMNGGWPLGNLYAPGNLLNNDASQPVFANPPMFLVGEIPDFIFWAVVSYLAISLFGKKKNKETNIQ